jgi:hypothetical protein
MLQSKTKTLTGVDGRSLDVATTTLPARRALKLGGKIGRYVGPALAQAKGIDTEADLAALAPALAALFSGLEDADYDALLLDIFAMTSVTAKLGGESLVKTDLTSTGAIDNVFGRDVAALVKAAAFVLEVNFGDFIAGALRTIAEARARQTATKASD